LQQVFTRLRRSKSGCQHYNSKWRCDIKDAEKRGEIGLTFQRAGFKLKPQKQTNRTVISPISRFMAQIQTYSTIIIMLPPAPVRKFATTLFCLGALALPVTLKAQTDTFTDGDDTSNPTWTHDEPLSPFGAGGTWTFPGGNTYRIQAAVSPDPGTVGPARAASTLDTVYTDFYASVDLVDWDDTLDQAVG
jgi:hypothetical protein